MHNSGAIVGSDLDICQCILNSLRLSNYIR